MLENRVALAQRRVSVRDAVMAGKTEAIEVPCVRHSNHQEPSTGRCRCLKMASRASETRQSFMSILSQINDEFQEPGVGDIREIASGSYKPNLVA